MTFVVLVGVPLLTGLVVWCAGDQHVRLRAALAVGGLMGTLGAAVNAAVHTPAVETRWGAGLTIVFEATAVARAPIVLVPFVATAVVTYALGYGEEQGRSRLVGLLVAFVGAMELLLVAGDLITLITAWELVGLISWALIAHHWRSDAPADAAHSLLVTRTGDLGLIVAAGAAYAGTGSLRFSDLGAVAVAPGWIPHAFVAGIVVAAFAKSAQVPFSPWLFSAVSGPIPASALLHSATMVAAGAYLLARLAPALDPVAWFSPITVGVGLVTALAGGVVAVVQPEAKKLLAASTSAHYGFMIVAVGAGYPAVAIAHLVAHGVFKAALFIAAGVAIDAAGSSRLDEMRIGGSHRVLAGLSAVGALALAAVPPLGGACTKDAVVSAASHEAVPVGILVVVAGALSAFYATRFQLLAYGPGPRSRATRMGRRFRSARVALVGLTFGTIVLSILWLPWGQDRLAQVTGGHLPPAAAWEFAASVAAVVAGVSAAAVLGFRGRLASPMPADRTRIANWFGIPHWTRIIVVDPVLALADRAAAFDDGRMDAGARGIAGSGRTTSRALAGFDDRVVDAGIRTVRAVAVWSAGLLGRSGEGAADGAVSGVARLTAWAGRGARRLQTGQVHHYYALVAATLGVATVTLVLWR
ncbi:NADH-quinone oxidoreductase subunit L [soil metagenome]